MKTVFTNAMCAHVWAQQSQPHGRSASMRFDRDVMYSYKTPIARIVGGMNVALVTSESYSMTTSTKHMPAVHRALSDSIETFYVPIVTAGSVTEHSTNLGHLISEYDKLQGKIKRASYVGDWQYEYLSEKAERVQKYAAAFGLPVRVIDANADADALRTFRAEREARLNTPANVAKRERARAMRETYRANAEARKQETIRAAMAEQITRWRNREINGSIYGGLSALLRLSADGATVQTSQGATVPVDDARRAVAFIGAIRARGQTWYKNGEKLPVGQFQVDLIEPSGNIRAGCHKIEWSEIAHLATLLGVPA